MSNYTHFAVYLTSTGEIVRYGVCTYNVLSLQPQLAGEGVVSVGQAVYEQDDWVNAGVVEQRPGLVNVPATKSLVVDEDWIIPGVPDGTEVWVDGALIGTVDATGLTLSFPMAETWNLRLVPPFPWKPASCEVTVS